MILLLLDFDGTLSPLAPTPKKARMPRAIRSALLNLGARPSFAVSIVTGRSVHDVKALVRSAKLYYAGNHGLEITGPHLKFKHPRAFALRPVIKSLEPIIKNEFRKIRGVIVEDKGLTLSIHYRRVKDRHRVNFRQKMRALMKDMKMKPIRWMAGKRVWEMMPMVAWHKGRAALFLSRHLRRPFLVAVGDDNTDEDMFRSINRRGISIRVGRRSDSVAQYYLESQPDVLHFLKWLHSVL